MLAPIILFAVSGFAIAAILGVKTYQQARGVTLPFAETREAVERKMGGLHTITRHYTYSIYKELHITVLERALIVGYAHVCRLVTTLNKALTTPGHWLDRRTHNLVSLVRGRQHLPGRGAPSSYMRDISHR